jgi:hypothetical protein
MSKSVKSLNELVSCKEQFNSQDWKDYLYDEAVILQRKTKSKNPVEFLPEIWEIIKSYFVGGTVNYKNSRLYKSLNISRGGVRSNLIEPITGYKKNDIILLDAYDGFILVRLEENVSQKKVENAGGECKLTIVADLQRTAYIPSKTECESIVSYRVVHRTTPETEYLSYCFLDGAYKLKKNQSEIIFETRKDFINFRNFDNRLKVYL